MSNQQNYTILGLEQKIDRYETALRTISSITKFDIPLEGAELFLFKCCSQMRRIAKEALAPAHLASPVNLLDNPAIINQIAEDRVDLLLLEGSKDNVDKKV